MFVNRKTTKFSLCFAPIHPVCGPVRTPISNDVHSPVSSDAAVFSDGLHHEGGPLVVGGRLDAVAVLVARRQLEPLVADLYDGCLGGGRLKGIDIRILLIHFRILVLDPKLFFVTGLVIFATALARLVCMDLLG